MALTHQFNQVHISHLLPSVVGLRQSHGKILFLCGCITLTITRQCEECGCRKGQRTDSEVFIRQIQELLTKCFLLIYIAVTPLLHFTVSVIWTDSNSPPHTLRHCQLGFVPHFCSRLMGSLVAVAEVWIFSEEKTHQTSLWVAVMFGYASRSCKNLFFLPFWHLWNMAVNGEWRKRWQMTMTNLDWILLWNCTSILNNQWRHLYTNILFVCGTVITYDTFSLQCINLNCISHISQNPH